MTCREFADFLADYLAGDLDASVRAAFEHHLEICINCQRYLAHYRESSALGRAAFADLDAVVPDDVPEDLIAAILAARR
jgi:anti-sigma factor RsiW